MTVVVLNTTAGNIEISQRQESGKCWGCNLMGGGLADFAVVSPDYPEGVTITICGSCLASSLGEYFAGKQGMTLAARARLAAERRKTLNVADL